MTAEKTMRKRVIKALKPLHAISVENGCGIGTPDVNFAGGWIELKSVHRWPKREDTPLRVPHFSDVQKYWLARREAAGERNYVLVKVGRDWFLMWCGDAISFLGNECKDVLRRFSIRFWEGGLDDKELLECLQRRTMTHL